MVTKTAKVQPYPIVSVFGSSRALPSDPDYAVARRLGQLVAKQGWTLCNGGHEGTMEAAALGAKEFGGATIGVSLSLYRPTSPNRWLDQEIVAETLFSRLEKLASLADAYIALHGGIGTLLEVSLVWNLVQTKAFELKPLVVVGPEWNGIFHAYQENLALRPDEAARLTLVDSIEDAVDYLTAHLRPRGAMRAKPQS